MIQAEKISVGPLETNCYIIWEKERAVVIDPGAEAEKIEEKIKASGAELAAILLTHGHYDHVGAAAELKARHGAGIYMHELDADMIGSSEKSLSFLSRTEPVPFEPDVFVGDGDELRFGEISFKVLHTPGHSAGGVCYATGLSVFCGDLIFRRSIGRFDFGNFNDEINSVHRLLSSFPDETLLLPGHGESTTVGYEKKYNPYIR